MLTYFVAKSLQYQIDLYNSRREALYCLLKITFSSVCEIVIPIFCEIYVPTMYECNVLYHEKYAERYRVIILFKTISRIGRSFVKRIFVSITFDNNFRNSKDIFHMLFNYNIYIYIFFSIVFLIRYNIFSIEEYILKSISAFPIHPRPIYQLLLLILIDFIAHYYSTYLNLIPSQALTWH